MLSKLVSTKISYIQFPTAQDLLNLFGCTRLMSSLEVRKTEAQDGRSTNTSCEQMINPKTTNKKVNANITS